MYVHKKECKKVITAALFVTITENNSTAYQEETG